MALHIKSTEWKKKKKAPANQEYSSWQSCPSELKDKEFSRQGKAEGIHLH